MALLSKEAVISALNDHPEHDRLWVMGVYEAISSAEVQGVELPLKIGDEAYILRNYKGHKEPRRGIVTEIYVTQDMKPVYIVRGAGRGLYGDKVFKTKEECEEHADKR